MEKWNGNEMKWNDNSIVSLVIMNYEDYCKREKSAKAINLFWIVILKWI